MSQRPVTELERAEAFAEMERHLHEAVDGLLNVARILACTRQRIETLRRGEEAGEPEQTK